MGGIGKAKGFSGSDASMIAMKINMAGYAETSANWGGMNLMVPYLVVCGVTFVSGAIVIIARNKGSS